MKVVPEQAAASASADAADPPAAIIRRALVADVAPLGRIINDSAERGLMLHRSPAYLYEHVRDFHVAVEGDRVVGVCGLSVIWANLGEIYALAVDSSQRGRGIGSRLVEACVEDARSLGIRRLMSLTYQEPFFRRLGFVIVDRLTLPLKVWSECARCPKNEACDEIAMIRELDVPMIEAPAPPTPSETSYVVPVVLSAPRRGAGPAGSSRPPA